MASSYQGYNPAAFQAGSPAGGTGTYANPFENLLNPAPQSGTLNPFGAVPGPLPAIPTPTAQFAPVAPAAPYSPTSYSPSPASYTTLGAPSTVGMPNPFADLSAVYPNLAGTNAAASGAIMSELSGQLSPATLNAFHDLSNTFGMASGMPGSGLSTNQLFGNVAGFTENRMRQGLQDFNSTLPMVASTQTVSPQLQSQIGEFNAGARNQVAAANADAANRFAMANAAAANQAAAANAGAQNQAAATNAAAVNSRNALNAQLQQQLNEMLAQLGFQTNVQNLNTAGTNALNRAAPNPALANNYAQQLFNQYLQSGRNSGYNPFAPNGQNSPTLTGGVPGAPLPALPPTATGTTPAPAPLNPSQDPLNFYRGPLPEDFSNMLNQDFAGSGFDNSDDALAMILNDEG